LEQDEMAKNKPPPRPRTGKGKFNESRRGREWLEEDEVKRLRKAAASTGRHGHRDSAMILIAYRHGLRVSELCALRWDQVNLDEEEMYIRRLKQSKSGKHSMERDEVSALRKLGPDRKGTVFQSERGGPMDRSTFRRMIARAGELAGLGFPIHPHMLRHACGYSLGNAEVPTRMIQDWLGHKQIQHTVKYTELNPDRFRKAKLWSKARRG
jgi:integrase